MKTNRFKYGDAEVLSNDFNRRVKKVILTLIITSAMLMLLSGRIDWNWGWIYIVSQIVYTIINSFLLPKELIAERGKIKEMQNYGIV